MKNLFLTVGLALTLTSAAGAADDIMLADFEGADYGAWKATGEAFGKGPAQGTLRGQMAVSGYAGHGLVNSFTGGDRPTGKLTSPEFKIERKYLTFLIGGGGWAERTCMNLLVGTGIVRCATGPNTEPGGSEELAPASWDVGEFLGQTAHLEIVDNASGGWGHINVDRIALSDHPAPVAAKPATLEREIALEKTYLLFPVQNVAKKDRKERVSVSVGGAVVREFDIALSETPDWFAQLDVSAWRGQKALVRAVKIPADSKALELVATSDTLWHADEVYREPLRGQLHFSPRRGWNNDPNGMVFAGGEYHLYFQHNPYGWPWGNMHWGHAVSADLAHWRELPIAIYPRQHGDWAFSGSAVVDRDNTSGWRTGTNELIVAAFTSTARGECIVYSNDRGRTFEEFAGNPVVKHAGRDPRLFRYAPEGAAGAPGHWVMAVYDEFEGGKYIAFHTSPDLKSWTFRSRIEGFFECPDIFPLSCGGRHQWVLTAAKSDYMVGQFDGGKFIPETPILKGHQGKGFYAAQTFSHDPQGRVVRMGWFQTATPGMPFNQSMSLPIELGLAATPEGPRLTWTPAKELAALRGKPAAIGPRALKPGDPNPLAGVQGELLEVRADLAPGTATEVAFVLRGARIAYDAAKQELVVNDVRAPAPLQNGRLRLTIYVDRTALEVFASDGLTYVPVPFAAKPADRGLEVAATGGEARIESLQVWELKSIWGAK